MKSANNSPLKTNTLLHKAIGAGDIEQVRKLLDQGADINSTNEYGSTPLHLAVGQKNAPLVNLLLSSKDINLNLRDSEGRTPVAYGALLLFLNSMIGMHNNGIAISAAQYILIFLLMRSDDPDKEIGLLHHTYINAPHCPRPLCDAIKISRLRFTLCSLWALNVEKNGEDNGNPLYQNCLEWLPQEMLEDGLALVETAVKTSTETMSNSPSL